MKIRYLPTSPKSGTVEHVRNDVGNTLVAAGFAEALPLTRYGTPEWIEERRAQSAAVTAPSPYDVVPSAPNGISWGIKKAGLQVFVLKYIDGQLFFLDGPPPECPAGTRQQFLDACAENPEANATALILAQQAQAAQDRADKSKGKLTILSALFGKGKVDEAPKVEVAKVGVRYIKNVDGRTEGNVSWVPQSTADELVRKGEVVLVKTA